MGLRLGESLGISEKAMESVYQKFFNKIDDIKTLIEQSFLSHSLSNDYLNLVIERRQKLD